MRDKNMAEDQNPPAHNNDAAQERQRAEQERNRLQDEVYAKTLEIANLKRKVKTDKDA